MKLIRSMMMNWNQQPVPLSIAANIGWNLPIDVVGSGVYGGIVKRDDSGRILIGDEWPEDNVGSEAHNPVHSTGPYLDFAKYTPNNRGYSEIALSITHGDAERLQGLFAKASAFGGDETAKQLANLVMTGGARPLHMCGMSRGGDASDLIETLLRYGAEVNAKDNYEYTAIDRLSSNSVEGNRLLRTHGGKSGQELPKGCPNWTSDEFSYTGPGE